MPSSQTATITSICVSRPLTISAIAACSAQKPIPQLTCRQTPVYTRPDLVRTDAATVAASVNYKWSDNLTISLDGLNLNNPTLKYYGDNKEQPRAFYSNGRQFYLSARMKF